MKKVIIPKGKGHSEFKSEKPAHTVPVIVDQIVDEKTGEVTHYICEGGKIYIKALYDQNFHVNHGLKMRDKRYKGKSMDRRVIY
jgi:hypothetical protein